MNQLVKTLSIALLIVPTMALAQQATKKKAPPANAKKSLHDQVSGQGYGMAGCGLGSIVFGPAPGAIQIVAATLNGTGYQTFALTSGTSNCDITENGYQAAMFIEMNREILKKEVARGNGETVASLAMILNCNEPARLGDALRRNFGDVMDDRADSYEKTRRILRVIDQDSDLKKTCDQVG